MAHYWPSKFSKPPLGTQRETAICVTIHGTETSRAGARNGDAGHVTASVLSG
jgi:hypothetical protein